MHRKRRDSTRIFSAISTFRVEREHRPDQFGENGPRIARDVAGKESVANTN